MDLFCHTALIPVGLAIGRLTACSTGMRFLFDESVACDGGMKVGGGGPTGRVDVESWTNISKQPAFR